MREARKKEDRVRMVIEKWETKMVIGNVVKAF